MSKKIAEGGQAEIFNAEFTHSRMGYVLKAFKEGYSLRDLENQWLQNLGLLQNRANRPRISNVCTI